MKIKFNLQKKIIISTILLAFFITTNNASALFNIDFPNLIQNTTQVINQIKEGVKTVQEVKNTLNTVKNTAQSLKNFDLTQAASNASGVALSQIGDIVTKNIGTSKDSSTNVFTNGQQIIGDLNNYLNKSSTNAIKKSLNDLQGADTNPYQSSALTDTIKKLRNDAQSSVDKLKVVGLAAVAQKEICNDVKLKDVIKKGEPAGWINPKPALKNVNIDELCNADLTAKDTSSSQNDVYNISSWKIPLKKGMSDNNTNVNVNNTPKTPTNGTPANNSKALTADDVFIDNYMYGSDSNPQKLTVKINTDKANSYSFIPDLGEISYTIQGNNGYSTSVSGENIYRNGWFSYSTNKKSFIFDSTDFIKYFEEQGELEEAGKKYKIKSKITLYASKDRNQDQRIKSFSFNLDLSK